MKKFRFQFETLEKVRRTREGEALRLLSEAQAKVIHANEHKQALIRGMSLAMDRRAGLGGSATSPLDFMLESDFIAGQKIRIVQAEVAIQRSKRAVEKALRNYLHAKRQTRVIEMIREKRFAEYKLERAKHLQKEMDDVSTMRNRLRQLRKESA
jgi:flagellar FliJ protein